MLIIRQEQMDVLRDNGFIPRAEQFIQEHLSGDYEAIGREGVLKSIDLAVVKCRAYGLRETGPMLRYLNVMYTLGFLFDEDPRYEWAKEILNRKKLRADSKLELICARVCQELKG